jgi:hypothetical protein
VTGITPTTCNVVQSAVRLQSGVDPERRHQFGNVCLVVLGVVHGGRVDVMLEGTLWTWEWWQDIRAYHR